MNNYVIGIMVSTKSVESITQLFGNLPIILQEKTSFIVAQEPSSNTGDTLLKVLAKETIFPVMEAENNQQINEGIIYLIPAAFDVQVSGGMIYLSKSQPNQNPALFLNTFFSTLANAHGEKVIGIILSDIDSKGIVGLEAIKDKGGHVISQNTPPGQIGHRLEEIILDAKRKEINIMSNKDLIHTQTQKNKEYPSEEILKSLLKSNSSYLIRTDMEGNYTYVNDAFCKEFGLSREEYIGTHYESTVHPADLIHCEKAVAELFQDSNGIATFEIRKPNPKGGYFHTQWEFIAIKNQEDEIIEIQGLGRDITGYKLTQEALEKERNQLEMMIWGGMLGTWDWNVSTGDIIFNDRWAEMMGYLMGEINNFTDWVNLIHPEDKEKVLQVLQDSINGHTAFYEIEHRKRVKSGEWKWHLITGRVLEKDEDGKATRLVGIHQDITEKKKAQGNSIINELKYRKVIETQTDFVLLSESDTTITYANEALLSALGVDLEQIIGTKWIDFADAEDIKPTLQKLKELHPQNPGFKTENRDRRAEDKIGWTEWINQGVFDGDGKLIQIQSAGRDITALKEAQQAISQRNEELLTASEELRANLEELSLINRKLVKSEEMLNKAQNLAKIGSWEFDLQTFDLVWSKEHYQIFELQEMPADKLYEAYQNKIHRDDIARLNEVVNNAIEKGENFVFEHRVSCKDGNIKYVVGIGEVLKDEQGKPVSVRGTVQDVTDSKKADEILKNEQKRFQDIVDSTDGIVWELEFDTFVFTYVSQKASRLLGYDVEEWYQPGFWESHIHPDDKNWAMDYCATSSNKLQPHEFEYRFFAKDGAELWLRDIVSVVSEKDKPVRLRGIMIDVTERKKLEEELYKLSIVAQRTSNVVIISDVKRRMIWVNEAFTYITGYTLKEVFGKTPRIFQFEDTDAETVQYINEHLNRQDSVRAEILNKGKDGRIYWMDLEIQPLFDSKQQLTGYMAVQTDITAKKNTQKEIEHLLEITRQQNQRLREYAYITSHNIRSSVANLLSLTEMIQQEPTNPDFLEMIHSSVIQLDTTIMTMNHLLRIENDSQTLAKTQVNLLEAVHNNCELIQNLIKGKVKLIINVPEELDVYVIPAYLDSILNNLLTNAIKYRRDRDALVEITGLKGKDAVVLSVRDNGIGIDLKKHAHKLFKMNSRLTYNVEGKGIGLFFTKHQIESMGGRIEVESEFGQGSAFKVWFNNAL